MKALLAILLLPLVCLADTAHDRRPATFTGDARSVDEYAGLGWGRDAEQFAFSQELLVLAQLNGWTVKISTWMWRGRTQYYVQRLVDEMDGCQVWQGPNPPMGYHTAVRTYQIISYASKS